MECGEDVGIFIHILITQKMSPALRLYARTGVTHPSKKNTEVVTSHNKPKPIVCFSISMEVKNSISKQLFVEVWCELYFLRNVVLREAVENVARCAVDVGGGVFGILC